MRNDVAVLSTISMLCGTALIFGVFIWPTPYKCESYPIGVLRINRFTGNSTVIPRTRKDEDAPTLARPATEAEMAEWPGLKWQKQLDPEILRTIREISRGSR
jgi:hypothetical protein